MAPGIAAYDTESGQVFKEWTIPRLNISEEAAKDWWCRRPYPLITARGVRGPRPLVDIAINVVASHMGDVTEDGLDALPRRLLWRIWRFLEARGVCLHAWKLLTKILLKDEDEEKTLGMYRFRHHICKPGPELRRYIEPLASPSVDFISHLVISGNCDFDTHDLLCLAEMRNLGVLELIQPSDETRGVFPDVTDKLVRGWTEKDEPFPLLRALRIWRDRSVSENSLHWVSLFPSLVLYDVKGSRDDWQSASKYAKRHGWRPAEAASELQDSLLRYLMLFAPAEATWMNRLKNLGRTIDSDLRSLCGDSMCAVKLVNQRQAPPLLDYLTDIAKVTNPSWDRDALLRDAGSCHSAPFEAWAFWIYSLVGQLGEDWDLRHAGVQLGSEAIVGPFVLPSQPFVSLALGHSGRGGVVSRTSYVRHGPFSTERHTFTRQMTAKGIAKFETREEAETGDTQADAVSREIPEHTAAARRLKRKHMGEIWQSFSK